MDFDLSEEQQAVFDLAGQIFSGHLTPERFLAVEATEDRVDRELWTELANAGLIGISLPGAHGGGDQEFLATSVLLEQAGRHVAPVPLLPTTIAALAVARFGSAAQQADLLPRVAAGGLIMTAALVEADATVARERDGAWTLSGSKTCVAAGPIADRILVPASTGAGTGVFIVDPSAPGVTMTRLV
ncbi:MAG: acyl-CoA dehydrogenase family protein, partial [Acidimicrobiales bacterium]